MDEMDCKNCENYILSECVGFCGEHPNLGGCFVENIYSIKSEKFTELTGKIYALANKNKESQEKGDFVIADLHKNKTKSRFYPLWRKLVVIGTKNLLDTYQLLNVNLTLKDFRGESFYAGIPPVSSEEIKCLNL